MKFIAIIALDIAIVAGYYFVIYLPDQTYLRRNCLNQAQSKWHENMIAYSISNPQPSRPEARHWNNINIEDQVNKQLEDDKRVCYQKY